MNSKTVIKSEVDNLKRVLIHSPGIEHNYLRPLDTSPYLKNNNLITENKNFLLFDDLIDLKKAMSEHQQLKDILTKHTDGNCLEFSELLIEVLHDQDVKVNIIKDCAELEKKINNVILSNEEIQNLTNMSPQNLSTVMISGRDQTTKKIYFKYPLVNLIFTRDIAVVVGSLIIITWANKKVRNRENILTKYIFKHNKLFSKENVYIFNDNHPNLSLEGGDFMVPNKESVLIGISERTTLEAIESISQKIFDEGFKEIYGIQLPKKRSLMHLDTVITNINKNQFIVFPPLIENEAFNYNIHKITKDSSKLITETNLKKVLIKLFKSNQRLSLIRCGAEDEINQLREQWTDGANAFTLSPGKIIGYNHNHYTIDELIKSGYSIIDSTQFSNREEKYSGNLFIGIEGLELGRGRGGPRCLTLPLLRASSE